MRREAEDAEQDAWFSGESVQGTIPAPAAEGDRTLVRGSVVVTTGINADNLFAGDDGAGRATFAYQ